MKLERIVITFDKPTKVRVTGNTFKVDTASVFLMDDSDLEDYESSIGNHVEFVQCRKTLKISENSPALTDAVVPGRYGFVWDTKEVLEISVDVIEK